MKTLTTFFIVALSFGVVASGSKLFAQNTKDASAVSESDQLDVTILQLREQLSKLENERGMATVPSSVSSGDTAESSSLSSVRSGDDVFGNSQTVDVVPAQLPAQVYAPEAGQHEMSYIQTLPQPATLPSTSSWIEQPMSTPMVTVPPVSELIPSIVQPAYETPATLYSQPAPLVEQPVIVQQAPAFQTPPTVIVNIYQQAPAPQASFVQPILAPIHGAPIQFVAPRRGCCLFGRR